MKSRLAPTPSGFLHLGNAANFLLTQAIVKANEGQLLLRIDDLDATRARQEYVENVFTTLEKLGITIDEGPTNPQELGSQWSQQYRLPLYHAALAELRKQGVLYACNCSRKKVSQENSDGIYRGHCRDKKISLDEPGVAWRIQLPSTTKIHLPEVLQPALAEVDLWQGMGDFVVRKKDGIPAYQIASLIDDCYFEVSDIIRGEDLLMSSAAQIYLAQLLGKTEFLTQLKMYHHPLLTDENGAKLSKSAGALAIESGEQGKLDVVRIRREVEKWMSSFLQV
jgi:glutamyl-tRNA synthetase